VIAQINRKLTGPSVRYPTEKQIRTLQINPTEAASVHNQHQRCADQPQETHGSRSDAYLFKGCHLLTLDFARPGLEQIINGPLGKSD
jgi:hypothetical protein